ncbi:DUF484 family protein [Wenzhouxiangella sp. XN79A]|uniref:DUF484 family protein n=1 Tax=Wenzhouxiangella sp. XN79A TaxID=2724193 RepID=UPI00144A597D|nr:DUF484 family protein [Wenzhouxiangella sp. XN79A]NKI35803.1 DUF484 family protein [Wenzhouxiangella sp. XN79A]
MAEPDAPELTPSADLDPERVADWLAAHPGFLADRPELAERLSLPDADSAVSLTEFRSRRLVEENDRLKLQLAELASNAGRNEDLTRRLHVLTLALAEAPDAVALFDELAGRMTRDFSAEVLHLRLSDAPDVAVEGVHIEGWPAERPDWLRALLDEGRPECGRLTRAKRDFLFGDEAEGIGSAALVPLADDGLLAIGASDHDRFQPGMGTLFLELLGETLAHRLRALAADGERRRRA